MFFGVGRLVSWPSNAGTRGRLRAQTLITDTDFWESVTVICWAPMGAPAARHKACACQEVGGHCALAPLSYT
eukprot:16435460-Heterocapsa_arctica.AAC.1